MNRNILVALAAVTGGLLALPVHAASLNASDWVESTFDASGNEGTNAFGAVTQSGSSVVGALPTDTPSRPNSDGGGQGFEDVEHFAATGASLVGDLSGNSGLSATFSLNLAGVPTIPSGAAFTAGEFGGESGGNPAGVRLYFKSGTAVDPGAASFGGLSEWWYNPNPALVTSLSNGGATTLNADFTNLAGWTDINGLSASDPTETAAFQSALSQVTSLGLSLGSGNFFSDGFGFNTGGTGTIELDSFVETTAVPLPAAAWSGLALLGGLGLVGGVKRLRRSVA